MPNIIPKLNLNKTPQLVENNSLVFSKNIRLDVDGTIHEDHGIMPLSIFETEDYDYPLNCKNILKRILFDIEKDMKVAADNNEIIASYYPTVRSKLNYLTGNEISLGLGSIKNGKYRIVGAIPSSNEFYIFIHGSYDSYSGNVLTETKEVSCIIIYDEKEEKFKPCNCNWKYSNGTITGCVINNLLGEKILNIGEIHATKLVPLKSINLTKSTINDDEQLYTQTPNIPITNLKHFKNFSYVIPNGVYQFFVRYKIRDNFYTDWLPASKELFAGNSNTTTTSFGTVKYVNTHRSSDNSFVFNVEHLFSNYEKYYESFQIGFICSSDDTVVARAWKHFKFDIQSINFDYKDTDSYEIEVTDLTKYTYQIYDVGNITSFKNKLYVSNYKETNFNDSNIKHYADNVNIDLGYTEASTGYGDYAIATTEIQGEKVISGLGIIDEAGATITKPLNGVDADGNIIEDSIFKQLLTKIDSGYSVENIIEDRVTDNKIETITLKLVKDYNITVKIDSISLDKAKKDVEEGKNKDYYRDFKYSDNIEAISINGKFIEIQDSSTDGDDSYLPEDLFNSILSYIYSSDKYLKDDGTFIDDYGNISNKFTIILQRPCTYKYTHYVSGGVTPSDPSISVSPGIGNSVVNPGIDTDNNTSGEYVTDDISTIYEQQITITFTGDPTKWNSDSTDKYTRYTTLLPYQHYKFYIHYVKQNGEITNGYYCGGSGAGIIEVPYRADASSVIYPIFSNIEIPEGYVGCFFSIHHSENQIATVFNIDTKDNLNNIEASCIDINLGLFPGITNINVKQQQGSGETTVELIDTNAKFYHSSDSSNTRYFGASGILTLDKAIGFDAEHYAYAINPYKVSEADDIQLIKCTPFISSSNLDNGTFSDYTNMNLLGYICKIYPLDRDRTITYYTDGSSSVYKKSDASYEDESFLSLKELTNYLNDGESNEKITAIKLVTSDSVNIYSNYNLNYMTLTEEPKESYKTYYNFSEEDSSAKPSGNLVLRLFSSLIMSSVYSFESMYKTYTRKTYATYNTEDIVEFNNTVRSSELGGDESSISIFRFDANDYYNIPTNRGIIVNLIAVGDNILVHTQDSMFKFSGSNTLSSSDGEIQTTENQPFNTGVAELFGSDFGYAGLQSKSDCITTENGYIFFDRDARTIYLYSGQGQITKISESVEKLFRFNDIKNIHFANDYYNNRFFVSIKFSNKTTTSSGTTEEIIPVTLSFNVSKNIASFVSLHDFYYGYAFNTKTKCYFLTDDQQDICTVDKKYPFRYSKLGFTKEDKLYVSTINKNVGFAFVDIDSKQLKHFYVYAYYPIIDIIVNSNYDNIKTLNYISFTGGQIDREFYMYDVDDIDKYKNNVTEYTIKTDLCFGSLKIYNDLCTSAKIEGIDTANTFDNTQYPRYNQGMWTVNYFRNSVGKVQDPSDYISDEDSLIEGTYFVISFMFEEPFVLKSLTANYNIKI